MKKIGILGSTGSIGTQSIDIIKKSKDRFDLIFISGHKNIKLLKEQADELNPQFVLITDLDAFNEAKKMNFTCKILFGMNELVELINVETIDILLNALVGHVGLIPTYTAVKNKVPLALANKESLVTAGHIIMKEVYANKSIILPVDSEHSAIFQSLQGNKMKNVEKLILTASGGPFRSLSYEEIYNKKAFQALKHPNWTMGRKISIDSATLVNKGLEVIEAKWLFDIPASKIDVVVHPQSIIHSLVQYNDSSIIAQMGRPDMRVPIHYALNYPERINFDIERFDFMKYNQLTFESPDHKVFPGLSLGYTAIEKGNSMPTVYNTVNEVMVNKFLMDQVKFYDISDRIELEMNNHKMIINPSIEEIIALDKEIRMRLR
ncbi:MAG: 1-deoxy-D-xylulose-5-phosphate reductoisomerase [Clostridiales bacterium]|nr:1-deoxy-D-xylulose-5-phosphate reductoisomerase [Clostridiales bacterium]